MRAAPTAGSGEASGKVYQALNEMFNRSKVIGMSQ